MSYCDIDIDEGDLVTVLRDETYSAKNPTTCIECGENIPKGSRYTYECGVCNREMLIYKTCLPCREIRSKMGSFCYGRIYEDLKDCMVYDGDIPLSFLDGLSLSALEKLDKYVFPAIEVMSHE